MELIDWSRAIPLAGVAVGMNVAVVVIVVLATRLTRRHPAKVDADHE